MYDIIIIGGGPAGISAALYAVSRGKSTLVLEKERIGVLAGTVSLISHYASVADGETGPEFAAKLRDQATGRRSSRWARGTSTRKSIFPFLTSATALPIS